MSYTPLTEGYNFIGWDKNFDYVTSNMEINAVYKIQKYTVRFLVDGKLVTSQTVEHGKYATKPENDPKIIGKEFTGWNPSLETPITANTDFNATFTDINYTVKYDKNGQIETHENVHYGDAIPAYTGSTEREGYIFKGWESSIEGVTTGSTMPAKDLTFTALYDTKYYTVKFYVINDETGEETLVNTQTVAYHEDAEVPYIQLEKGYILGPWDKPITQISMDLDVHAHLIHQKYKLTFLGYDSDEEAIVVVASGSYYYQESVLETVIEAYTEVERIPHEGYIFSGWTPDDVISAMTNYDITYEAVYDTQQYTIYWMSGSGLEYINEYTEGLVDFGTPIVKPEVVKQEYCSFDGNWTKTQGSTEVYEIPEYMPAENLVLYPINEEIKHTCNFYAYVNSGETFELIDTQEVLHGHNAVAPELTDYNRLPGYLTYYLQSDYYNITTDTNVSARTEELAVDSWVNEPVMAAISASTIAGQSTEYYTMGEATAVNRIGGIFNDNLDITSFDEFRHFTGVTMLYDETFADDENIESISLPSTLTTLGDEEFRNCYSLTNISTDENISLFDANLENIEYLTEKTFLNCSGLTSVYFSDKLTNIVANPFVGCSQLSTIVIDDDNTTYSDVSGNCIYNLTTNTLVTGALDGFIPEDTVIIGVSAFEKNEELEEIEIPDTVTTINNEAFKDCTSLTSITIGTGVTTMAKDAFDNIPEYGVIHYPCSFVDKIIYSPWSGDTLGQCVFIRKHWTYEPDCTDNKLYYKRANGNTDMLFEDREILQYFGVNCLSQTSGITYQGETGWTEIVTLGNILGINENAFKDSDVEKVVFPNALQSIGNNAFENCPSLSAITSIDGENSELTFIGYAAFKDAGVSESIFDGLFTDNLEVISEKAFENCGIKDVYIGQSVNYIGAGAFYPNNVIDTIYVHSGNTTFYGGEDINCCINNDNNVVLGCNNSVLGEGINGFESQAFITCDIEELILPTSVNTIGYQAFKDCTSLVKIKSPKCQLEVNEFAFEGIPTTGEIIIPCSCDSTTTPWAEIAEFDNWTYTTECYITFTALENNVTISFRDERTVDIQYSLDKTNWQTLINTAVTINEGEEVYIRGNNPDGLNTNTEASSFNITGKTACDGDIMTLLDYNGDVTEIPCAYCFKYLFSSCTGLTSSPYLSATVLKQEAYYGMFYGCSSLEVISCNFTQWYESIRNRRGITRLYYTTDWVEGVPEDGVFVCNSELSKISALGYYRHIPWNWLGFLTVNFESSEVELDIDPQYVEKGGYALAIDSSLLVDERKLFRFVDWFSDKELTSKWVFNKMAVYQDMTLYAKWEAVNAVVVNYSGTDIVEPNDTSSWEPQVYYSHSTDNKIIFSGETITIFPVGAFSGNTDLITINIPYGTEYLYYGSFSDCTNLTKVSLPSTLKNIGFDTFKNCTSLTDITLPDNLVYFGDNAFENTAIESVKFPNGIIETGMYAFYNCSGLTDVTMNDGLEVICEGTFQGCDSLTSLTIPTSVHIIDDVAFADCSNLEYIDILRDSSVIALSGAGVLTGSDSCEIYVPDVLMLTYRESKYWEEYADRIFGQYHTCHFNLNGGEGEAEDQTIRYGNLLEEPTGITKEGYEIDYWYRDNEETPWDFDNDIFFEDITLTAHWVEVHYTYIYYTSTDGNPVIPYDTTAFTGATYFGSELVSGNKYRMKFNGNSITEIGENAFYECNTLNSIIIPNTVTKIGNQCFYCCYSLTNITIPNSVSTIGQYCFTDCYSLNGINIPNNLTTISIGLFIGCTGLTEVVIPNNVTNVRNYSFQSCTSLNKITFGSSINTIGNSVFTDCPLTSITLLMESNIPYYRTLYGLPDEITYYHYPEGKKELYATNNWPVPYTITLEVEPEEAGIVSGGGTYKYNTQHEISATANTGYEFSQWDDGNTDNPRTITVTGDTTYVAEFSEVQQYTITVQANDSSRGTVSGSGTYPVGMTLVFGATANTGYEFVQWQDGNTDNPRTITVTRNYTYTADFEEQSVPTNQIQYTTVSGNYVAPSNKSLVYSDTGGTTESGYDIATSESNYGTWYFNNQIKSIGKNDTGTSGVFQGVTDLKNITLPNSVEVIGRQCFSGCTNLESVTLPNNLKSIGYYAFHGCSSLIHIDLPNTVTTIGHRDGSQAGIADGSYIEELIIPSSVNVLLVVNNTQNNTHLTKLTLNCDLPNSLLVNSKICLYCSNLTTIEFGSGVTTINDNINNSNTFYGCPVNKLICHMTTTIPAINNSTFYSRATIGELHVPRGHADDYSQWKKVLDDSGRKTWTIYDDVEI